MGKSYWYGYVKSIIRRYRHTAALRENAMSAQVRMERDAVSMALDRTMELSDGAERCAIIKLVFFDMSHTLEGAASKLNVSYRTARRWQVDFVHLVAHFLWHK